MAKQSSGQHRGDRHKIISRSLAIAEIFRLSEGKQAFDIESLTDALLKSYPDLFDQRPHATTITRIVDALTKNDILPISRTTAKEAGLPFIGSPRKTVWIYSPQKAIRPSLQDLSDVSERIDTMIGMAVAADAVSLIGLRFHDQLKSLQRKMEGNSLSAGDLSRIKAASGKYSANSLSRKKRRHRSSLAWREKSKILRVLDECIRKNLRLEISHKHQSGQGFEKKHILEPQVLDERNGSIFLFGHVVSVNPDERQLKQFKLDRIMQARKAGGGNRYEYDQQGQLTGREWPSALIEPPPFPLEEVTGCTIHSYLPRKDEQPISGIVIEATREVANWVREETLNPLQRVKPISPKDAGAGLRVEIDKAYMNDLVPRILGLGPFLKVISPPALVAEVKGRLAAAIAQYNQQKCSTKPTDGTQLPVRKIGKKRSVPTPPMKKT